MDSAKVTACDPPVPSRRRGSRRWVTLTPKTPKPCRQPQWRLLRCRETLMARSQPAPNLEGDKRKRTRAPSSPKSTRTAQSLPLWPFIFSIRFRLLGQSNSLALTKARALARLYGMQLLPAREVSTRRAAAEILRSPQCIAARLQDLRPPSIWIESQSKPETLKKALRHPREKRDSSPQTAPAKSPRLHCIRHRGFQEEIAVCEDFVQSGRSFAAASVSRRPRVRSSRSFHSRTRATSSSHPHRLLPSPSPRRPPTATDAAYTSLPLTYNTLRLSQPVISIGW